MLKVLFLLLLLLNSAVLLWELRSDVRLSAEEQNVASKLPSIPLVSELPKAEIKSVVLVAEKQVDAVADTQTQPAPVEKSAVVTPVVTVKPAVESKTKPEPELHPPKPVIPNKIVAVQEVANKPEPEKLCYEAGPFANAAELKHWTDKNGVKAESSYYRESQALIGYQVYYPVGKDNAAQLEAKQTLKSKGINDMWMITEGERRIGLSLGVFVDKNRAQLFKNQLQQRGLNVDIQERHKNQQQMFAKIHADKAKSQQLLKNDSNLSHCSGH